MAKLTGIENDLKRQRELQDVTEKECET